MRLPQITIGAAALCVAFAVAWRPANIRPVDLSNETTTAPAAIQTLSSAEIAQASATIDRMLDAAMTTAGVAPNPILSDAEFLRRTYVQITGRIPTADEALVFLSSTSSAKRSILIDRLVNSEGRVFQEFSWWADLLRVQTKVQNRFTQQPFIDYLKDSIRANTPYDVMVRQMLTADGFAFDTNNGAASFWLRDQGMPLDRTANISQVFLSTQIGCAQCHDHPFDSWKRAEFFKFAAYLHSTDARRDALGNKEAKKAYRDAEKSLTNKEKNVLRRIVDTIGLQVDGGKRSDIKLPEDYQYADHKPNDSVDAAVIFGAATSVAKGQDPRVLFAQWMTSSDNPRFTLAIANRLWKRAFGVGLIEPVDDIRDNTEASNPELMTFLTQLMVSVNYDIKAYQTILYQTKAWQRSAVKGDRDLSTTFYYEGPVMQRLTAEQIWDSLLTLTVPNLDGKRGATAENQELYFQEHKDLTPEQVIKLAQDTMKSRLVGDVLKKQADALKKEMKDTPGRPSDDMRKKMKTLNDQMNALRGQFDPERFKDKPNARDPWLRAAELQQPASPGHFLAVFGQSDREIIENRSLSANVTQALHLMNGPIEDEMFKKGTPIQTNMDKATDAVSKTRALYLAILSRQPNQDELRLGAAFITSYGEDGQRDLAWALINANEFLFCP